MRNWIEKEINLSEPAHVEKRKGYLTSGRTTDPIATPQNDFGNLDPSGQLGQSPSLLDHAQVTEHNRP